MTLMREMLEAGVHFGHQTRFWNPKMAEYIFGQRNKIHIINLERTVEKYLEACQYVRDLVARGGTVLFVGTKRAAREILAVEARRCGMPYVDNRWLGGMMTNFKTVKTSIKRLKDMEAQQAEGVTEHMIKKEALVFEREMAKLNKSLGGIKDMNTLPDALFVIDVGYHKIAVAEAHTLGIPVIGVVDTNHSPEGIAQVIPGNDDSAKAIVLYAQGIADAVLAGREQSLSGLVEELSDGSEFIELEAAAQDEFTDIDALDPATLAEPASEAAAEPAPQAATEPESPAATADSTPAPEAAAEQAETAEPASETLKTDTQASPDSSAS